ncbi:hypothetical protein, partial [Thiolapillus sp.]|uniref:hypothetical protein n=1 Tax=Thiolapillus sp. TaxID=2017437 RepID=UPI003AF92780
GNSLPAPGLFQRLAIAPGVLRTVIRVNLYALHRLAAHARAGVPENCCPAPRRRCRTDHRPAPEMQACLRPRDRFWDIPVPKIDSAFDNLLVPQPSWSPSTTQQLRKLVAAPYLAPNDWTPRSEAYFVFPLAQGTPGKQCGLAATGVYQPSLRSPWLAVPASHPPAAPFPPRLPAG